MSGQPKLFGGSLEEYLEATNQEIPLIIKSCVRVINLYGILLTFLLYEKLNSLFRVTSSGNISCFRFTGGDKQFSGMV